MAGLRKTNIRVYQRLMLIPFPGCLRLARTPGKRVASKLDLVLAKVARSNSSSRLSRFYVLFADKRNMPNLLISARTKQRGETLKRIACLRHLSQLELQNIAGLWNDRVLADLRKQLTNGRCRIYMH